MSIMKLRIRRLYDKLETVNNKYPDLIQEVISKNKNKYNGYFQIGTEVELENQINSLIESIATLSKKSKANITCELLDGFNKSKYEDEESSQENYNWAEEAFKWYKKFAEQGHANAQYKLGVMYSQGEDVEQDDEEAFKCFI